MICFQTIKNSRNCLVRSFNLFLSSDVNSCPMSFHLTEGDVFFASNLVLFHSIEIVGRKGRTKVSFYEQISLCRIKKSVILRLRETRMECASFHVQVSSVGCSTEYKIGARRSAIGIFACALTNVRIRAGPGRARPYYTCFPAYTDALMLILYHT